MEFLSLSDHRGLDRLQHWKNRPVDPRIGGDPPRGARRDAYIREFRGDFARAAEAILGYRAFPDSVGIAIVERSPVQVGDTVGMVGRVFGPLGIFLASRVCHVIDEPGRAGFRYQTLVGHPECGEETFLVEQSPHTGLLTYSLTSWSMPGVVLARLTAPLLRHFQVSASHASLDWISSQAEGGVATPPAESQKF